MISGRASNHWRLDSGVSANHGYSLAGSISGCVCDNFLAVVFLTFDLTIYSAIYFSGSALCIAAAVFAWRRRTAPGGQWLLWVLITNAQWALSEALDYSSTTLAAHVFWGKVSYFGATTTAVFFVLFALEYSGQVERVRPGLLGSLLVMPALSTAAAFTNEWHWLLWTGFAPLEGVPHAIVYYHGPLFWITILYGLLLGVIASALMIGFAMRTRDVYRHQSVAVVVAVALPWAAQLIYSAAPNLVRGLDPGLSVSVTGVVLTITMVRYRLLDLVPVAREVMVERMSDGLLVLDSQGRVVDINPAGMNLLELGHKPKAGESASDTLPEWADAARLLESSDMGMTQQVLESRTGRYVGFDMAPLVERNAEGAGVLVTMQDLTEFTITQDALHSANEALQARLVEIGALQAELVEQAIRDPLTGLYNRRYLSESIDREFGRATREGYPVSVVMVDIDRFKNVNDDHGHAAGDNSLRVLSSLLRAGTRLGDMPCRYGGDEFLVVLPNTGVGEASALAERWRVRVESSSSPEDGRGVRSTISLGVASFPLHGRTPEEVVAAADSAVYAAKAAGRNRVEVAVSVD
jgi:diguanylate cyclase (GGDEF)-like protein